MDKERNLYLERRQLVKYCNYTPISHLNIDVAPIQILFLILKYDVFNL